MTQEERENLISGFLSANAGNTDVNTTRMLNMLVESLAYSKLQELLPEVQKQSPPAQSKEKKKLYLKFTKKELEQMTAKYKHMFAFRIPKGKITCRNYLRPPVRGICFVGVFQNFLRRTVCI